ncbi:hypothetical protein B4N89_39165 [Embleya scabrispora]|uniref:Uncharacterized protein n=1 Tax=Embleya scabrispora TaxID=159449 RepID=A0A1T3NN75_9ACTN|nr:hypothetical protein [Embleya scabrispora]OPC78208.1 hypothetical protein B4N89_39165 [Embleya scabrispora]
MRLSRRIAATTGILAVALGGLAAAAPAAQAAPADCVAYLAVEGYTSMITGTACGYGANGPAGAATCASLLTGVEGVPATIAARACAYAGR